MPNSNGSLVTAINRKLIPRDRHVIAVLHYANNCFNKSCVVSEVLFSILRQ